MPARRAASLRPLIIAIDGPSGAGKGTVARELARRLNYIHLDTGAMYRAVAWKALLVAVPLDDEDAVAELAERAVLQMEPEKVVIDGHDVTAAIRTPEIDRAAAAAARLPKVREVLVAQQRKEGARGGIVMEGRDIGSVVFPNADVKIYLDASPEERARRRAADPAHRTSRTGRRCRSRARDGSAGPIGQDPGDLATDRRGRCRGDRHDGHGGGRGGGEGDGDRGEGTRA